MDLTMLKIKQIIETFKSTGKGENIKPLESLNNKKRKNLSEKILSVFNIEENEIVAVIDVTLFGSCKEGYVITNDSLYVKDINYEVSIPLDKILTYKTGKNWGQIMTITLTDSSKLEIPIENNSDFFTELFNALIADKEKVGPVIEHTKAKSNMTSIANMDHMEELEAHIEKYIGPIGNVWHELVSDLTHIDIFVVNPTKERDYYTLITSGMSALPMNAPAEKTHIKYAELLISLPPDWKLDEKDLKDENNYWPIRLLKTLARFPHEYETWLSYGHTIPNGNPPKPYSDKAHMNTAILLPPLLLNKDSNQLRLKNGNNIDIWGVIPLFQEEVDVKLNNGAEALFDKFEQYEVSELFYHRQNLFSEKFDIQDNELGALVFKFFDKKKYSESELEKIAAKLKQAFSDTSIEPFKRDMLVDLANKHLKKIDKKMYKSSPFS